jgi:hypothetical protein
VTEAAAADARGAARPAAIATAVAYGVLGAILVATRAVGLDRSLWHDEILTVVYFVREGPWEILAGDYIPNNHELYSLLGWATSSVVGESEVALRLWCVVPFVAGVVLVTAWLHVRVGALTGVLYLFFATLSPLLLDLSRQARGYGLAFLAMSVLVVAALEVDRGGRTWAVATFCAAGVVGTWTLPIFGTTFAVTGAVLLADRPRRMLAAWLGGSCAAIAAWYAPHISDLLVSSQQEFGAPIGWFGLPTSPVDQVVIPALLWIEGPVLASGATRLVLIAVVAVVLLSSPLLRERGPALVLCSSVAGPLVVVWATRLYLSTRFVSYLLVPLFVLLASGTAHVLSRPGRRAWARSILALGTLGLVIVAFVSSGRPVLRLPREAHADAVRAIREQGREEDPVLAYTFRPADLEYYLGRPPRVLEPDDVVSSVCAADRDVVYVTQPYGVPGVSVPCLGRAGVEHRRFEQYAAGGAIEVWFVPALR